MGAVEQTIQVGSYLFESAVDNLVATGSNQATALPLGDAAFGKEINRFTTVAAGTGCILPPAKPGLTILIINHGTNGLQVYGNGGDAINDITGATGVSQMVNSGALYVCTSPGAWYTLDLATGFYTAGGVASLPTFSSASITASTTHTQPGATPITATQVAVTVNNASDAVLLPASQVGLEIAVANLSATLAMQVYATGSDTINGTAGSTGVAQAAALVTIYFCFQAGKWVTK